MYIPTLTVRPIQRSGVSRKSRPVGVKRRVTSGRRLGVQDRRRRRWRFARREVIVPLFQNPSRACGVQPVYLGLLPRPSRLAFDSTFYVLHTTTKFASVRCHTRGRLLHLAHIHNSLTIVSTTIETLCPVC